MTQDDLYEQAGGEFGAALERFARSYEADPEMRRDLLQEIHLALWRSLEAFRGQCSLRTWVYRVAHNVSVSHVLKRRRVNAQPLVRVEDLDDVSAGLDTAATYARQDLVARLHALAARLQPLDREILLLYLEGVDAVAIGEITGISARNVATKVHRIKKILAIRFREGGRDGRA
jgi:RNA polymerase sigma-70 factor, ECF subfamily